MSEITHVHEGQLQCKNVLVPFVIIQDNENNISVEVGTLDDHSIRFANIEIAINQQGVLTVFATVRDVGHAERLDIGNLLTGEIILNAPF